MSQVRYVQYEVTGAFIIILFLGTKDAIHTHFYYHVAEFREYQVTEPVNITFALKLVRVSKYVECNLVVLVRLCTKSSSFSVNS